MAFHKETHFGGGHAPRLLFLESGRRLEGLAGGFALHGRAQSFATARSKHLEIGVHGRHDVSVKLAIHKWWQLH